MKIQCNQRAKKEYSRVRGNYQLSSIHQINHIDWQNCQREGQRKRDRDGESGRGVEREIERKIEEIERRKKQKEKVIVRGVWRAERRERNSKKK